MLSTIELNKLILDRIRSANSQKESSLDRWYEQSYPVVIDEITKQSNLRSKVTIAILATGAWVPKVVAGNIDEEVISQFEDYYEAIPGVIEYLKVDNVSKRRIVVSNSINADFNFIEYYNLCNYIVNSISNNRSDKNASTVSKFMHFLSPNIFPIFDINIAKRMQITTAKGNVNLSVNQYLQYISSIHALKEAYNETWKLIEKSAINKGVTPIRTIDELLFRE